MSRRLHEITREAERSAGLFIPPHRNRSERLGLMQATAMSSCSTAAPAGTASSCSRRRSALDLGPFEARMSNRVGEGGWKAPAKPAK